MQQGSSLSWFNVIYSVYAMKGIDGLPQLPISRMLVTSTFQKRRAKLPIEHNGNVNRLCSIHIFYYFHLTKGCCITYLCLSRPSPFPLSSFLCSIPNSPRPFYFFWSCLKQEKSIVCGPFVCSNKLARNDHQF